MMPRSIDDKMADKLILFDSDLIKRNSKPITQADYPKFIKIVKAPPVQPVPQTQMVRHFANVMEAYHDRISSAPQMMMRVLPRFRPDYTSWNHPSNEPKPPGYLYKSTSYDGQTLSLADLPTHRVRNIPYYNNSPKDTYEERNLRSRNVYDDNALIINGYSNSPYHLTSLAQSIQSQWSSMFSRSDSAVLISRDLEVEMVDKFQDYDGKTIRVVKPIGERSRIIYTKPDNFSNFFIVENSLNEQQLSPLLQEKEEKKEGKVEDVEMTEKNVKEAKEEKEPKEAEEKKPKGERESEAEKPPFLTTATQTQTKKKVTYRDNKTFKMRQELARDSEM